MAFGRRQRRLVADASNVRKSKSTRQDHTLRMSQGDVGLTDVFATLRSEMNGA